MYKCSKFGISARKAQNVKPQEDDRKGQQLEAKYNKLLII